MSKSYSFSDLRSEYALLWRQMRVLPSRSAEVHAIAARLLANKSRYQRVSHLCGAPWFFIAALHQRESSASFSHHLHEGSPLTDRTRRIPKGRPANGSPPFTWEASAIDALTVPPHDMRGVGPWSIERICFEAEKYNGFGYRKRGRPSSYLWSFTTAYQGGKFVADGVFDRQAMDKQCGVMAIIKRLAELDHTIDLDAPAIVAVPAPQVPLPDLSNRLRVPPVSATPQSNDALLRLLLDAILAKQAANPGAPGAPEPKILSPIDKILGGDALAGSKTTLSILAYALLSILQATGGASATSTTSQIMTTLIASFGGLGVLAKVDRAIKAISIVATRKG